MPDLWVQRKTRIPGPFNHKLHGTFVKPTQIAAAFDCEFHLSAPTIICIFVKFIQIKFMSRILFILCNSSLECL